MFLHYITTTIQIWTSSWALFAQDGSVTPLVQNFVKTSVNSYLWSNFFVESAASKVQLEALSASLVALFIFANSCLVASWLADWYSFIDCGWSIIPVVYAWIFAAYLPTSPRLLIMAILATIWGVRLTYNFNRRGGYSGGEDYRWEILKKRMTNWQWQLFNISFTHYYQSLLLYLITLPAYAVLCYETTHGTPALSLSDYICTAIFLCLIFAEWFSDQTQWEFHQQKNLARSGKKGKKQAIANLGYDPLEVGFACHSVFKYSRHPNFFCEQSIWVTFYAFSLFTCSEDAFGGRIGALAQFTNPSIIGAVLLILLFQGSTAFTEAITSGKYPKYKEYQKCTSMLIPMPPSPSFLSTLG